jgi:hypothetical protein
MFKLSDAYTGISYDDIKSKVSEYDLWRYYCHNFKDLNRSFKSELYNDKNPSCRIFKSNDTLLYKDFGDEGIVYNVPTYIQAKYKCTYIEALKIIVNDFKIFDAKIQIPKTLKNIPLEETLLFKPKPIIEIKPKSFTITDYDYWHQYHITLELLTFYNVQACEEVHLHKDYGIITFYYRKDNPIYAYKFTNSEGNNYKIYFPKAEKRYKWLFSGNQNDIEGFDQLDWIGDNLILTKSLKDCMVYRLIGLNAISLQGEANKLSQELVTKLLSRYNQIIVNYDNDTEGIKGTKRLENQYEFKYFFIDEYKDISDYCKAYGLEKTKELIINKLK